MKDADELSETRAALHLARAEATASAARLQALGWLVEQQQHLTLELHQRLTSYAAAPTKSAAFAEVVAPAASTAAAAAELHLRTALAALAQCALSLASEGQQLPLAAADAEAGHNVDAVLCADHDIQVVQSLTRRIAAALGASAGLAQCAPVVDAAAARRLRTMRV